MNDLNQNLTKRTNLKLFKLKGEIET
jgi:hypothetical protein